MTEEMTEIARRAVACKGWRWLRGMLRHDDYRYVGSGVWARWSDTASVMTALHMPDQLPDLTDSATLGCLLALVREAWGEVMISANATVDGWVVNAPLARNLACCDTEVEALVVALEAAR